MILKFIAVKILSVCEKYKINTGGCAYSFGDQKPSFSKEWLDRTKEALKRGSSLNPEDGSAPTIGADSFFKSIGFSDYYDIDYNGNARLLMDLGKPIPKDMYSKADFLYDGGVIEHIPNIYQAMCNAMLLLKKGGLLIQCVPAAVFGGACYYNIDPTLFRDFYGANGIEMIECLLYCDDIRCTGFQNFIRELTLFKQVARIKAKPFVPARVLAYYKKRTAERKNLSAPKPINDDLRDFYFIDPFDPVSRSRLSWYGPQPGTHICFMGIKRHDIDPDNIAISTQDIYPSKLNK